MKLLFKTVILLLLLVAVFSGYKIISYNSAMNKDAQRFEAISKSVMNSAMQTDSSEEIYSQLYEQNSHFFGYIKIEGTKIDYPVMHTPNDPEFYLYRAFDKSYSKSGVPFMSADCFERCGNYIIYAHNMKNGSMFASLLEYESEDFFKEHKIISFDTVSEKGKYEVIASFITDAEEGFQYHLYSDLTKKESFEEYIKSITALAFFDTGAQAVFGDTLITLSTCAYNTKNGRFVVVAKKITE